MRKQAFLAVWLALSLAAQGPARAEEPPQLPSSSSDAVEAQKMRRFTEDLIPDWKPAAGLKFEDELKAGETAPQTEFYVREIVLEGNTLIPEEEISYLLLPFLERTHTLETLNEICRAFEAEYQKRGYITIVYVPPQRMEGQRAVLKVVISRLGEVHVEGAKYFNPERTRAYWTLPAGKEIGFDAMRENVLRMNENPDRSVRVALKAGKEAGLTDVYLMEQDRYPLHAGMTLDNQGSRLTGKLRPSVYIAHNNATGQDDTFLAHIAGANDMKAFYLYHALPLPTWDLKLVTHWAHSAVAPKKEFNSLDMSGVTDDYGFELRKRLIRQESRVLDAFAGFDFNEKRTIAIGTVITRDRLRTPYFGLEHQSADAQGVWMLSGTATFGLPFKEEAVNLTSRQAGSSFSKLNAEVRRLQRMPGRTRLEFEWHGQWSPNDLVPQEQLFMGGMDSIRGYPESDYGADLGYWLNLEFRIPGEFLPGQWQLPYADKPLKETLEFFTFFDHGYGWLVNASESERSTHRLTSLGLGATLALNDHLEATLCWGFPIGDASITESGRSQAHFKIRALF